jgi:hypothetical protein
MRHIISFLDTSLVGLPLLKCAKKVGIANSGYFMRSYTELRAAYGPLYLVNLL